MKKLLISFLLFLLAFVGRADASIRTVCASGCDYSTVQTAYTAALSGDELVISPGTYTETTNLSLSLDKNITIRGATGNAADVTITASATNQVIYIGANGVSITIKDLTISGAAASGRGQIEHRSYSTNLILDNVIFTDTAGNAIPNLLLGAGSTGSGLQIFLNQQGFLVAPQGPGSPGHETETFGYGTQSALIRFQHSNNLPGSGFFGPMTRKVVQSTEE